MKTIQNTHPVGAFFAQVKKVAKWTFWTITAFVALTYAAFLSLIIIL